MTIAPIATPNLLTDPGYLFIGPLLSTLPSNTVVASQFTDDWPAAWLPLGATEEGSEFKYSTSVEAVRVAEFFDPIRWATTDRSGSIAFALAHHGATNYRRALNGGVTALAPTSGSTTTALYTVEPPTPGSEVRAMLGWESQDHSIRLVCHQTIQGGEVNTAAKKAPAKGLIPCTYNLEVPAGGKPFTRWFAGDWRA